MGKSKIEVNSYVKLTVADSNLFGKVSAVAEDGQVTIALPTGASHTFASNEKGVEVIDEATYNKEVRGLIETMSKSISLDISALETKANDLAKSLDEAKEALKTAQDKLDAIEADKVAAERLASLKSVESVDVIDADETKATAALKIIPKNEFDTILKTATIAFKKLTEMRKTNLPALTDQTQTSQTKLTQAEQDAKVADAIKDAKAEDKESLANAAVVQNGASALETLVAANIKSRHSKKNK